VLVITSTCAKNRHFLDGPHRVEHLWMGLSFLMQFSRPLNQQFCGLRGVSRYRCGNFIDAINVAARLECCSRHRLGNKVLQLGHQSDFRLGHQEDFQPLPHKPTCNRCPPRWCTFSQYEWMGSSTTFCSQYEWMGSSATFRCTPPPCCTYSQYEWMGSSTTFQGP